MPYDQKLYDDAMRTAAFSKARRLLDPVLDELFPGEHICLEKIGLRRDFNTEAIELRLHIHPLASTKAVGSSEWQEFVPLHTRPVAESGRQHPPEQREDQAHLAMSWWWRVMPNRFRKLPPP